MISPSLGFMLLLDCGREGGRWREGGREEDGERE